MKIELHKIKIRDLVAEYEDNAEGGVRGYGGQLDIRPPYQREFIYAEKERNAVIDTVMKGFPLNVMYWVKRDDGGDVPYEVLDGQQRTISICQYAEGDFSFRSRFIHNLTIDEQNKFLDYALDVYICSGTDSEKLDWFRTINIAGKELTPQELRNAVYSGPYVSDAKRYFSKNGCPAYAIGSMLVSGFLIRQDFLQTALKWKAAADGVATIEEFMGLHQHDPNAIQLWNYFQQVVNWATANFNPKKFKNIVKGLEWGALYEQFHTEVLDTKAVEQEMSRLLIDEDVQKHSGIIPYILMHDERLLGLRAFPEAIKLRVYEKQGHKCALCGKEFEYAEMEGDHITPWRDGGRTVEENCQMLCRECNRRKGAK